jgi:hypothetical protein
MGRKTRRREKRRHKRLMRLISLLEASNCDPKRHNRKTRRRELLNVVWTDLASLDSKKVRQCRPSMIVLHS